MKEEMILRAKDKPKSKAQWALLCIQHVFAMFSATVLVPMTTGLPISVALFASGVGTLIYILCTKGKVPIYLGSSFAYMAYIGGAKGMTNANGTTFFGPALTGLFIAGLVYIVVSIIIKFVGVKWLNKLLPPIVVGPTIIVIGLGLAGIAVGNAGFFDGNVANYDWRALIVALFTMVVIAIIAIKGKGMLKIIPFLIGILVGYVFAVLIGFIPHKGFGTVVDFQPVVEVLKHPAQWFKLPTFQFLGWKNAELGAGISMAKINFSAALSVLPLAFVTMCEHIGDHKVLGKITGEDYISDPGLHRTLLGDGVATAFAALIGGPANTSYGENTSVVGMTKVGSVWVTGGAAIIAILLSCCNIVTTLIASIPACIMGGVCLILYGFIASNGLRILIDEKIDITKTRNLIIISVILVIGLGAAVLKIGSVEFSGMAVAAIAGILLNLCLPGKEKKAKQKKAKEEVVENKENI